MPRRPRAGSQLVRALCDITMRAYGRISVPVRHSMTVKNYATSFIFLARSLAFPLSLVSAPPFFLASLLLAVSLFSGMLSARRRCSLGTRLAQRRRGGLSGAPATAGQLSLCVSDVPWRVVPTFCAREARRRSGHPSRFDRLATHPQLGAGRTSLNNY